MNKKIVGLALGLLLILGGCGSGDDPAGEAGDLNSVEVKKNGTIINTIEGAFDKEYYDKDSLKEFVQEEVDSFNESSKTGKAELKKLNVKGIRADIILQFDSAQTYSAFNKKTMYYGTVEEASEAGYDLQSVTFRGVEEGEVANLEDLAQRRLVVTDENMILITSGDILFVSDNTGIAGTNEADTPGDALAYVIYK